MFKFGITGCGRVTEKIYIDAIRKMDGAKIVAVADPLKERRKIAISMFPDSKSYNSIDDLLKYSQIDGLIIASPSEYHVADLIKAINYNVPVLVEKPLALNTEQLHELTGLTNQEKKTVMIGFNRRYWDPIIKLKNNCMLNRVSGEYRLITNYSSWNPIAEKLDPLDDLTHHQIDLTRFITKNEVKSIEILDKEKNIVKLLFEKGSVFKLMSNHSDIHREYLKIKTGDKEYYINSSSNRISPNEGNVRRVYDVFEKYVRLFNNQKSSFNLSYRRELLDFMKNVDKKQAMSPGLEDGVIPVKIVEAIRKSSYNGEEIKV